MTRRSGLAVVVVAGAVVAWWGVARLRSRSPRELAAPQAQLIARLATSAGSAGSAARARGPGAPSGLARDGGVVITGHVIEIALQRGVGNVEVVFRGTAGDASTTARADGGYAIRLAPGSYRAFVRDDAVLSVGRADRVRLPGLPSADTAGVPDEALMPVVTVSEDADGVDLAVVRAGRVSGHVVDTSGHPVAGAMVRARSRDQVRPSLATDVAESDRDGGFELRLATGAYELDAAHPRFAGILPGSDATLVVGIGAHPGRVVVLTAGCVISGQVVDHDGQPAGDGAIESPSRPGAEFAPAGRVEPDGTFRWVTTAIGDVAIRAWPWKSPPSQARRFACRDGARFTDVVLALPERAPDLEGVLVDHAGEPVGFAHVDLEAFDSDGIAQQERTDATGHWAAYDVPKGRYRVIAQADGRGVTSETVVSPRDGVRLELGGTGRLEGTTTRITSGSFELVLGTCLDSAGKIPIPQGRRLVHVRGGRFAVDGLPACQLSFAAIWRGWVVGHQAAIVSGSTARVTLDLGPPHAKTVHGVVRDDAGQPVTGAIVTATQAGANAATARTDSSGAYKLQTSSGASLRASVRGRIGLAQVGSANVDREQVDIAIDDAADD